MSWSFSAVGKASAVAKAIEESSNNNMTGQSLAEWQEAKPSILALVKANTNDMAVKVSASGSASWDYKGTPDPQEKTHSQCACVIEALYGFVE